MSTVAHDIAHRAEDRSRLRATLKDTDLGQAKEVFSELYAEFMPKVTDFKNQGEKLAPGQDGCVAKLESAYDQEAVWGQNNLLSAHFLTEGAEIQKAIAMVTLKVAKGSLSAGSGWGSGFLVSNSLFMTNNHVIPTKAFCDDVNMQFMYQDSYGSEPPPTPEFFETAEDSFFHTNAGLDYTIVRLKRNPYRLVWDPTAYRLGDRPLNYDNPGPHEFADADQTDELEYIADFIARKQPVSAFDPSRILHLLGYTAGSKYGRIPLRPTVFYPEGLRLNVIQHPDGRKKEVVVQQNELTDVHTNVIHYFSDTDYGSSGSPVFDNKWDLMALHHAREPAESANEGMRIDKIVADLRSEFQSSNPGILTEMGI